METTQPTAITELPNLPIPIISVSSEGIILSVNPQAIRDFGGEQGDLVNKSVNDLLSDQKTPDALHALFFGTAKAAKRFEKDQTDKTHYPEIRIRTKGKGDRIVQIRPKFIVEGEIKSGFEIVVNDITQQKQAEALRKTSELLSSNLTLEEILKTLPGILRGVVPHDSANIMLLNDDHTPSTNLSWTYDSEGNPVQRTPTFNNIDNKPALQKIINTQKPVIIDNTGVYAYWEKTDNSDDHPVRSYLGIPILSEGKVIGFLNFNSYKPNTFSSTDLNLLQEFSSQLTQALTNAVKVGEISRLAIVDGLTGLHNRKHLDDLFLAEIKRALRFDEPLATVLADIDNFKRVNDTYGHQVSDQVLREIAQRLNNDRRDIDHLGRYGGEEFEFILPNTNVSGGHVLAEKFRALLQAIPIRSINDHNIGNISISMGIASFASISSAGIHPTKINHETLRKVLRQQADEALYVVKALAGKNGVGIFIPRRTDESEDKVFTDTFDQVIVIKPKKTSIKTINIEVSGMQTRAEQDYWEVQVYKRVVQPDKRTEESISQEPIAYESLVKYNVYKEEAKNNHYIFRVDPQSVKDLEYPTASLKYDKSSYLFDEGTDHHQAVKNGSLSPDSFAWVKVLFPPHSSHPQPQR